jgi:nucleotide-binding universal stress UspA family protein
MKTIRSILAAVDLGAKTPAVLRTADVLAAALDARLHLVHAVDLDWPSATSVPTFKALFQASERRLDRAVARGLRKVKPGSREVVLYTPHRTIADRARQVKADLIVMGAHAHRRAMLGTTVDRLLRTARCPCWITQRQVHLPLGRIVIATDLSVAGHAALDSAATIVRALGRKRPRVEVVLLHVTSLPARSPVSRESRRMLEDQAAGWLVRHDLETLVRMRPVMRRAAQPASGIVQYVRRQLPDLFIIATHGRGGLDRLVLGSVATRVLRAMPCDALAVPPAHRRKR